MTNVLGGQTYMCDKTSRGKILKAIDRSQPNATLSNLHLCAGQHIFPKLRFLFAIFLYMKKNKSVNNA